MRSPMKAVLSAMTLVMVAGLTGCSDNADEAAVTTDNASTAGAASANETTTDNSNQWMSYGRDSTEQRYSPLNQITADNINELSLAWYGDLTERGGSYETTPVVVDGRVYVTSPGARSMLSTPKPACNFGNMIPKYRVHGP